MNFINFLLLLPLRVKDILMIYTVFAEYAEADTPVFESPRGDIRNMESRTLTDCSQNDPKRVTQSNS